MSEEVSDDIEVPAGTARPLPFAFAKRHGVFVETIEDGVAQAIYRSDASPLSLAETRRYLGLAVRFRKVDPDSFDRAVQSGYENNAAMTMVEGLDDEPDLFEVAQQLPEPSDLIDSDDNAPIIRLINALLTQAVKDGASDIHIEPYENRLVVRFRIDGVMKEALQSRRAVAPIVVSRIKVMSSSISQRNAFRRMAAFQCASQAAQSTCASRRPLSVTANALCCACSTSRPAGSI